MALRFDMIGIFVSDIKKMVSFYRDVLGVQITWDEQGPYAEFKHDGIRFSMYERSQLSSLLGKAPSFPEGINGTFELAIDLPDLLSVDKEYERIINYGGRPVYPPRMEPWGMYSSMITDPEGNLIEIGSWNKGLPPKYNLGVITISVSNLNISREFYENKLGFKADAYYEPTRWLSFKNEYDTLFAIQEVGNFVRPDTGDMIDFYLEDIESLWAGIKDRVRVISQLQQTPWGSYKFVIQDPDGYLLGFVKK